MINTSKSTVKKRGGQNRTWISPDGERFSSMRKVAMFVLHGDGGAEEAGQGGPPPDDSSEEEARAGAAVRRRGVRGGWDGEEDEPSPLLGAAGWDSRLDALRGT